MKKIIAVAGAFAIILSLVACSFEKPIAESEKELLSYEETQNIVKSIKDVLPTNYDYSVYVNPNAQKTVDISVFLNLKKGDEKALFAETTELCVNITKETLAEKQEIFNRLQISFLIYENLSDEKAAGSISYETSNLETGKFSYVITGENPTIQDKLTSLDVKELLCGKNSTASEELMEAVKSFQGKWKNSSYSEYIINGIEVNSVHYDFKNKNAVSDIFTVYFAFDEKGNLMVENEYGQARYMFNINENGELEKINIPADDKTETYKKISEDTFVPNIAEKPHIGMTQDEMYNSLWGAPDKVNKTTTARGVSEQWVYKGTNGYKGYVYFINGTLTTIQE